ncbi:unnamed protein product [Pedinophyceae sp. YPF-701]|nr:unnamed protein product [Pedinophyceae sp. YPF-701]
MVALRAPAPRGAQPAAVRPARRVACRRMVAAAVARPLEAAPRRPHVVVAGGGIGGLMSALALARRGLSVEVMEKVQEYKPFGGPIQLQCNALATLETIDPGLAAKVIEQGTVTGDRLNGLLDGVNGEWYLKFDTRAPCRKNGLPLAIVISRYALLDLLRQAVEDAGVTVRTGATVVSYEESRERTAGGAPAPLEAVLECGERVACDVLVGADGIRSRVRAHMRGGEDPEKPFKYAGYAVYTAVCDYTAIHTDTDQVGYQVFLGANQYFVSSDVGNGQQQYYAFLKVPDGASDRWARCEEWDNYRDMLIDRFQGWSPAVLERLHCTRPEDVERRDVNDLAPDPRWVDGRVALLGDACHAVQPNLGQGGGQAIESSFALADELALLPTDRAWTEAEVRDALNRYAGRRFLRAAAVHGLSRMASAMNNVYRSHLGADPYEWYPEPVRKFFTWLGQYNIPHPGRCVGQVMMMLTMPMILEYVGSGMGLPDWLGGASVGQRVPYCQVPGVGAPKRNRLREESFAMRGLPGFAD